MLEEGMNAPDFSASGAGGKSHALRDYAGKWLVLYFYPKDDTPGCTTEAKDFTTLVDAFAGRNAAILGVSKDTVAKHDKFIAKHDLAIDLISDETGEICEAYGVWVEKKMYGKTYMGIQRATFLIDPDGKLARIWHKVKVKGHAEDVLDALPT